MRIANVCFSSSMAALLAVVVAWASFSSPHALLAQDDGSGITLNIGSTAPSLNIENWVSDGDGKFEPVTAFEEGKVYVVEFWATWCGPCVASMPHLAETQEKYADQGVQIISVSDEDSETVADFLQSNVPGKEDLTYAKLTSVYCLTNDPDGSTSREYMEAAGQNGIPTAFIVGKTGLIEWTGHPMKMGEPLAEIVDDTWDRDAYKAQLDAQLAEERAQQAAMQKVQLALHQVDQQIQVGEADEALESLNKIVDDEDFKSLRPQLVMIRSEVAMTLSGPNAVKTFRAGTDELKEFPDALNQIAWTMVELKDSGEDLSDDMLAAGMEAASVADKAQPNDPEILDTLAHYHHLQGDLDKAIEAQERALANAGHMADDIKPFLELLKKEKAGDE